MSNNTHSVQQQGSEWTDTSFVTCGGHILLIVGVVFIIWNVHQLLQVLQAWKVIQRQKGWGSFQTVAFVVGCIADQLSTYSVYAEESTSVGLSNHVNSLTVENMAILNLGVNLTYISTVQQPCSVHLSRSCQYRSQCHTAQLNEFIANFWQPAMDLVNNVGGETGELDILIG